MNFKKLNFKGKKENSNPFAGQDKRNFWEYVSDNKKIVMPLILVVAVAITIVIALHANNKSAEEQVDENVATSVNEDGSYVVPEVDLQKNAYDNVNSLMKTYFDAYAIGDMDTIKSIYVGLESTEELRLKEVANYITGIPTIDVYTKPGPVEGSYVVYAYTEVLFKGYDTALPGMQTMYVCTDEKGKLYINGDVVDDRVTEYISSISLQDDVKDLNNEVAAKYNAIIEGNEDLAQFLSDMSAKIQVSVGEALAAIESGADVTAAASTEDTAVEGASDENSTEAASADSTDETAASQDASSEAGSQEAETTENTETASTKKTIKAIDVVNIRSSDSETADKIGKTEIGDTFTQLEALENGWSKIEYNGSTAYVKTMFFEEVSEDQETSDNADNTASTEQTETTTTEKEETKTETETKTSKVDSNAKGKMRVSETVRLRKSQSTDSTDNVITNIYKGDEINVIEQYANGWAKVEYNGKSGYIMSEYLSNE